MQNWKQRSFPRIPDVRHRTRSFSTTYLQAVKNSYNRQEREYNIAHEFSAKLLFGTLFEILIPEYFQ